MGTLFEDMTENEMLDHLETMIEIATHLYETRIPDQEKGKYHHYKQAIGRANYALTQHKKDWLRGPDAFDRMAGELEESIQEISNQITEDPDIGESPEAREARVAMDTMSTSLVNELSERGWNAIRRNPSTVQIKEVAIADTPHPVHYAIFLVLMPPTRVKIMEPHSGVGHGYFDMADPDVYDKIDERLKLVIKRR